MADYLVFQRCLRMWQGGREWSQCRRCHRSAIDVVLDHGTSGSQCKRCSCMGCSESVHLSHSRPDQRSYAIGRNWNSERQRNSSHGYEQNHRSHRIAHVRCSVETGIIWIRLIDDARLLNGMREKEYCRMWTIRLTAFHTEIANLAYQNRQTECSSCAFWLDNRSLYHALQHLCNAKYQKLAINLSGDENIFRHLIDACIPYIMPYTYKYNEFYAERRQFDMILLWTTWAFYGY